MEKKSVNPVNPVKFFGEGQKNQMFALVGV